MQLSDLDKKVLLHSMDCSRLDEKIILVILMAHNEYYSVFMYVPDAEHSAVKG